ncbi:YveK family protein [Fictibacillus barbaricus]|uniref:Capsular polysaccharide biosynthesis protein n=1 Tax=Fictibacillus barbaricus TaxID=182136 RepID=A0ABU1U1Q1_9BACL|nr:Wzz/FepE/Etk N-terminal domain-containing protein [Fictibacillus barbaricus]MDR7073377.1 capsular polysaccharide biosynthesis protein [Fictibacillus barbaricus]
MTDLNSNMAKNKSKVKEIDLIEIYSLLKRRFWVIVLFVILITLLGGLYNKYTTSYLYQSSTRLLIKANPDQMKTLMVMVKDPAIMEKVVSELQLPRSAEGLASQITVESIGDSQVVLITVVDNSPATAAMIANNTASTFKDEVAKILSFNDVQLLKEAKENPYPINDNKYRFLFISMVMGIVIGVGFVFFLNSLDETVKREDEIEELIGLPVIGNISKITKKNLKKDVHIQEELKVRGETVGI